MPRGVSPGGLQIQFGRLNRLENGLRMGYQPRTLCGQTDPPTHALQQRDPCLTLQGRKLLRHGRRGEPKRGADRGHGAAMGQFPEKPEAGEIEH
jgi:hypothetical protein